MRNLALALSMLLILYLPVVPLTGGQRLAPPRSYHSEDDDDEQVHEDVEELIRVNATDGSWLREILVQFKGLFLKKPQRRGCTLERPVKVVAVPVCSTCTAILSPALASVTKSIQSNLITRIRGVVNVSTSTVSNTLFYVWNYLCFAFLLLKGFSQYLLS